MKNYQYYSKLGASAPSTPTEKMAIAGNCATEALSQVIRGYFLDHATELEILDLGYDTASLSVLDETSALYQEKVSSLILYYSPLKLRDKFYQSERKENFARDFREELRTIVHKLKEKQITTLITSLPTSLERCFGNASTVFPESLVFQLEEINAFIKETVRTNPHCHLLDIEFLANRIGLDQFHSDKLWAMGKYPCHTSHMPKIAEAIYNVTRAKLGQMKKVLVLDLDNTLWGGVIGDDGVGGIALGSSVEGDAFRSFQYYLKSLKEKGFLLTVCSKNDFANAVLPFREHPEMVLKEEDITLFIANWEPKSSNIRSISDTLNLGLDSFVFIDDSPFERNEVRSALPEVFTPELSDDPSEYISILDRANFLENLSFTETDRRRSEKYKDEAKRQLVKNTAANIDDYLKGLEMKCTIESVNDRNIERASQLILRSNQFNLRTQRLSRAFLESIRGNQNFETFCFSLSDRFGDYGLISVVVAEVSGRELLIREFVMSCRVLKRGMEAVIFNQLLQRAKARKLEGVRGDFIPSPKNKLVENLFSEYAFEKDPGRKEYSYLCGVKDYVPRTHYIQEIE